MKKIISYCLLIIFIALSACDKSADSAKKDADKKDGSKNEIKPTLVTVTQVKNQALETTETALGTLEGLIIPTVAAEVEGRVVKMHVTTGMQVKAGQVIATLDASDFGMQRKEAQTEVARIEAQMQNQAKTVARNQALVTRKFISQNAVDNELAQQNVLKQQLEGAKARVGSINHDSRKTSIVAPVSGIVENRLVSVGEFVRVGDPIAQIVSKQKLRAHLPFPEQIAAKLKAGLKVRLSTPTSDKTMETVIRELKPMVSEGSRSIDIIADVHDAAGWQPGASVLGVVVLEEQTAAMMVPEQSVVLRPAGEVVYVIRDNTAYQSIVKTGLRQNGLIEIIEGVNEQDKVVVDGAGFLTDNTPVKIATEKLITK